MKRKKAISTIEFIVACAISALVITITMQAANIFRKAATHSAVVYSAQIGTRNSISTITERLRNASAIFLLPSKFFSPDRLANLPRDFSYFGVEEEDDRSRLVNYIMKEDGSGHNKIIVADASDGANYKIVLDKYMDDSSSESLIGVTIIFDCPVFVVLCITTSIKAFNARLITDWSSGSDAVAIAYSSKSESGNQSGSNAGAAIYMTVDNSASMTYEMSSSNTALNIAEMRAYYLRKAATGFIDALLPYDNVYLGMQGFFQYASAKQNQPLLSLNDPANLSVFHRLFDADHFVANYANFNSSVVSGGNWTLDPTEILGLGPGTNIGDGIRASFYSFTSDARSLGIDNLNKYMILLSDGEPNASTYDVSILGPTFDPSYVKSLGAQAANSLFYGGKLYATANGELENSASTETLRHRAADEAADRERGMAYALKMAEIAHMSGLVKDFYIVGIAELSQATLKLLAQSFGITDDLYDSRVFSVSDEIQLRHSLEAAAAGIAFDLEELLGKSLLDGIQD